MSAGPETHLPQVIEVAKTGRARCRTCRQTIDKGALRFGEEQPSPFSDDMQMAWHHLACAARKKPAQVREALSQFPGQVDGRDEIEKLLADADETVVAFPHVERAPTGRSSCLQCREPIEKAALRVAVQREVDVAGMARMGAGYLHPGCAPEFTGTDGLLALLLKNSRKLGDADRDELARALSA